MTYKNSNGHEFRFWRAFEGVITNLERRYKETNSEYIREKISEFMSDRPCPTCQGKRLNPAALAVTVDDVNIITLTSWPVLTTLEWVKKISGKNSPLTSKQKTIAERVLKLWEGLEQDLNYNAMVSQRGVLNFFHSDSQRDAAARRGNAMRMHGVDAAKV